MQDVVGLQPCQGGRELLDVAVDQALGQPLRRSARQVPQPDARTDLGHVRLIGVAAPGDQVDAVPKGGQRERLVVLDHVHAPGVARSGKVGGRGVHRNERDAKGLGHRRSA